MSAERPAAEQDGGSRVVCTRTAVYCVGDGAKLTLFRRQGVKIRVRQGAVPAIADHRVREQPAVDLYDRNI
jgi:hypothetical protein